MWVVFWFARLVGLAVVPWRRKNVAPFILVIVAVILARLLSLFSLSSSLVYLMGFFESHRFSGRKDFPGEMLSYIPVDEAFLMEKSTFAP